MKNLLRFTAAALAACIFTPAAVADAPVGYYNSLNGKKTAALKTAVYELVHNFTLVSSYSDLPRYFQRTDVYPVPENGRTRWWDMYSDIPLYAPSFSGLNREHSFPKSWWGGLTGISAYVDLNHLYPSEAAANMAKSNYPLGTVDRTEKVKFDNGISSVGYPITGQGGNSQYVFEPDDEYKGDFARTYFYMVTCYQNLTWTDKYMYMLQQDVYPTLKPWAYDLLLRWHREDPVSEKELDRNDVVYTIQNNRNPFIDLPELAEYIWGDKAGESFTVTGPSTPTGDPVLFSPVQDMTLDFGQVAIGASGTAELYFHGENLVGSLELTLYRDDYKMFSVPSTSIRASLVNNASGYWLKVTYTPTETGTHTARLLVSDGGIEGSLGISLRGECLEKPVLSPCTALAATDITSDSYRANWTSPADEVVDYWTITRSKYINGNVEVEEILAEEPGHIIEGFNESDQESYYVCSNRLGFVSAPSNVVFVSHLGITGVDAGRPLIVHGYEDCIHFTCPEPHTGVCVYDISGAMVAYVPEVTNHTEIELPAGVYMVTSHECPAPVKVYVK